MHHNICCNENINEIYWLEELSRDHYEIVGRKCANLGELTKLGLRVPMGFSVSIKAYEYFMVNTGLKEKLDAMTSKEIDTGLNIEHDMDKLIELSAKMIRAVNEAEMPVYLDHLIRNYYHGLQEKTGIPGLFCAVRSSGAVSMPGQMETYLNISGEEEIIKHVKKVWGSAFTVRAISYRLSNNMPVSWAPIGVAVVEMIEARSAGVIMTVLPTTGDLSRAIVEGNFGFGESIVSGDVNPDSFIVNKQGMFIESKSIPEKSEMTVKSESGTVTAKVPEKLRKTACLEDSEILEIVRVSKKVEEHFGMPQDMEWVVSKHSPFPNNIFWVQTRAAKYTEKKREDDAYVIDLMLQLFKK
ncbi:MAG: PEP/pyruvate-binding domain-containing protein [Clostridia bacterium]|nr:PEP/pyruvate-binding domain-containing protein [Clostridia bacterium]